MRLRETRRAPDRLFELLEGTAAVARELQRRAQLVAQSGVVWIQLDPFAKVRGSRREVATRKGAHALAFFVHRAIEEWAQRHHQRVGRTGLHRAPLPEVGFRPRGVTQSS